MGKGHRQMENTLQTLLSGLTQPSVVRANTIQWSCPIPAFGDSSRARVATVGLNPSNREFVDGDGKELEGPDRRFHTLRSLGLSNWADADMSHIELISQSCRAYFLRNPYDTWFRQLDRILVSTKASYYEDAADACHLDLAPYATACKWTGLTKTQKSALREAGAAALGQLLRDSPIKLLILNGRSVVEQFECIAGIPLEKQLMPEWQLGRRGRAPVEGYGYKGFADRVAGVHLGREVLVIGFNHNIQSSFGVSNGVRNSIRDWIGDVARSVIW